MSEKLFLDIWEKYECPEEVSDPLTIYNILNDIIVKSKHWIVLDHYSHINFDEVKKVVDRSLHTEILLPSRGVAASGFPPLCNIPHCCLP